jgi:YD repeat-containing protein
VTLLRLAPDALETVITSCTSPTSTTTYGYNAANDLTTKTFPSGNGYVETLTYDHASRMTGVTNVKGGTTLSSYAIGSRDGVGNPVSLTALSGGVTTTTYYTYDTYDRLTGACSLSGCTGSGLTGLGYTFDPVGIRDTVEWLRRSAPASPCKIEGSPSMRVPRGPCSLWRGRRS